MWPPQVWLQYLEKGFLREKYVLPKDEEKTTKRSKRKTRFRIRGFLNLYLTWTPANVYRRTCGRTRMTLGRYFRLWKTVGFSMLNRLLVQILHLWTLLCRISEPILCYLFIIYLKFVNVPCTFSLISCWKNWASGENQNKNENISLKNCCLALFCVCLN